MGYGVGGEFVNMVVGTCELSCLQGGVFMVGDRITESAATSAAMCPCEHRENRTKTASGEAA